jgi:hypothetical protein
VTARVLLALLLSPGLVWAQGIRADGGLGVSSGRYLFEQRTTTWSLSAGLSLDLGRFTFRGSIPVHLQNGALVAGTGAGHVPTGGSSSGAVADSGEARRQRGAHAGMTAAELASSLSHGVVEVPGDADARSKAAIGDPLVAVGWRLAPVRRTTLAVGAAVKLPLADTASYGTGAWDVGATAAVGHRVAERAVLGFDLGYWWLGDMPDLELRDALFGTVSAGYLGARGGIGGTVLFSAGTSALTGYDPPVSVGAGLHRVTTHGSWTVLGIVGLTETAPDLTLSALWSVRLTR